MCKSSSSKDGANGTEQSGYNHTQGPFTVDSRHTIQRLNQQVGFATPPVSMTTDDEPEYTGLQREPDGYENVPDTMRVAHNPDYMMPQKQAHDYIEILDDSESLPPNSASITNRPVSMETQEDGYSRLQSHYEG